MRASYASIQPTSDDVPIDEPNDRRPYELPRRGITLVRSNPAPPPSLPFTATARSTVGERVLVVGERRRTARVRERLENRSGLACEEIVRVVSLDEATHQLAERRFDVVILIAPIRGATIERALSTLRDFERSASHRILVAFVPETFPEFRARNLYERGAGGVFAWPDDIGVLPALLEKTLEREVLGSNRPAEPLESVVRDRLHARPGRISRHVSVAIAAGTARLSGRVSSLWAKLSLKRRAEQSPGIECVDVGRLEVEASDRSDATIGCEIRALLDGTASVDASTIDASVHDGRVVLLGVVLELERSHVIELISMVPGVRSVNDQSLSSRKQKSRARGMADRLQRALRRSTAGQGLRVAVVGKTAVLRGTGTTEEIHDARTSLMERIRASSMLRTVLQRAVPPRRRDGS